MNYNSFRTGSSWILPSFYIQGPKSFNCAVEEMNIEICTCKYWNMPLKDTKTDFWCRQILQYLCKAFMDSPTRQNSHSLTGFKGVWLLSNWCEWLILAKKIINSIFHWSISCIHPPIEKMQKSVAMQNIP